MRELILLLALCLPLPGAVALIGNTKASASGNSTATTPPVDTTGAHLLVAVAVTYSTVSCGAGVTMSDSKNGSTWTSAQNYAQGTANICIWYKANPAVGTGHTFSFAPHVSGGYPTLFVSYWSGAATTTPKDASHSGAGSAAGTTLQPGSITPSEDNELLITAMAHNDTGNTTVSVEFTRQDTQTNNSYATGAWGYEIQTTATARNPTWTLTTSGVARVAALAAFKAAGAAPPAAARRRVIN
jgi:hypothetical protein